MALVKIITGLQNSGKTTAAEKIAAECRREGGRVSGFFADAEYIGGRKSSYYIRNIETGERVLSVTESIPEGSGGAGFERYDFSRFFFYRPSFGFASEIIDEIIGLPEEDEPDLVVVDELGPLELLGEGHYASVRRLLENYGKTVVLIIREAVLGDLLLKLGVEPGTAEVIRPDDLDQV